MNNKGFSLIELLAVLVVLISIMVIAIPNITSSTERNKENMFNKKIDIIESAAEAYVNLYKNTIDYNNFISKGCGISTTSIRDKGLLTDEDLLDNNNEILRGYIIYDNNEYKFDESAPNGKEC